MSTTIAESLPPPTAEESPGEAEFAVPNELQASPAERKRREREQRAEARQDIELGPKETIDTLGELIDVMTRAGVEIDELMSTRMLEIEVLFPVNIELTVWKTKLGWKVRGR